MTRLPLAMSFAFSIIISLYLKEKYSFESMTFDYWLLIFMAWCTVRRVACDVWELVLLFREEMRGGK